MLLLVLSVTLATGAVGLIAYGVRRRQPWEAFVGLLLLGAITDAAFYLIPDYIPGSLGVAAVVVTLGLLIAGTTVALYGVVVAIREKFR